MISMDTNEADLNWGLDIPVPLAGRDATVANWVEEYKHGYFPTVSPSMQLSSARELQQFALFIGTRRLTKELVVQWCDQQKKRTIGGSTLLKTFATIKQFLRWCERMEYVQGQIAFLIPIIKIAEKPAQMFSPEQYASILEEVKGSVFYYAVVMAYNTGMRLSDVCLLKWENIDLEKMCIAYIPFKTRRKGHRAVCPIEPGSELHQVLADMDKCRSPHPIWSAYVCPGLAMYYPKDGGPFVLFNTSADTFTRGLKKIGARHLSFHKLRNSFMSRVVDADVSWPKVCQITGLKTFSVLLRYAKPNPDALRKDMEKLSKVDAERAAATGVKMLPDIKKES